jgi:molecular chaperone GrpE
MMRDDPKTAAGKTPPPEVEEAPEGEELQEAMEAGEGESPAGPATEGAEMGEEIPDGSESPPDEVPSEAIKEPPGTEGEGEVPNEASAEKSPEEELELALGELRDLRDRHLRLAADFENYRKRANADLAAGWVRAQAELVRTLTEGLDDLQRVSQFTSDDTTVEALIEGVDLVERKLLKALTEAGLEVLAPDGDRFDPNIMEAMMRVPTEEGGEDDTVHQVFQKGYLFKDQLVRPARVSVYKDDD